MRLLKLEGGNKFSLTCDNINPPEPYAILSHTWGNDNEEVSFSDFKDNSGKTKNGYKKIQLCGEQAARHGLQYFWVDTCCIDKPNAVELKKLLTQCFAGIVTQSNAMYILRMFEKLNHEEYDDGLPRST